MRLLIVDDHAVVRYGLLTLLPKRWEVEEAASGEEACAKFWRFRPDLTVMDLLLPGISGLEATRRIVKRDPKARVLVFSIHESPIWMEAAFEAGARGYLTKRSLPEHLLEAVERLLAGGRYLDPELRGEGISAELKQLSPREFEIFLRAASGETGSEIAEALHLSAKTVANYLSLIRQKLGLRTSAEMAHLARQLGLLP